MRDDVHDVIDVIQDQKIKAPIFVDAGLPEILTLAILLGAKRRVSQVLFQEFHLLEKGLAYVWRKAEQDFTGMFGVVGLHRERLALEAVVFFLSCAFMWEIISSALLKGPKVRPALMSARPSASWESTMRRCAGVYSS